MYISGKMCLDVIEQMPKIYDEPFSDTSQIPTFLVAKFAKEEVTVCLSGDGGDELFGGYNRYLDAYNYWRKFQRLPLGLRQLFVYLSKNVHPALIDALYRSAQWAPTPFAAF